MILFIRATARKLMARSRIRLRRWSLAFVILVVSGVSTMADDLEQREQEAFCEAVQRVAPVVVRIETIGGLERVGDILLGEGATTGLVIGSDGYIVTSAFNFLGGPSQVLVRLEDGHRQPATIVATDHHLALVLLKIETDQPLATAAPASPGDIRVGQWAIAVGRAFDASEPNLAVGIVSAKGRIWGKAIQTDAAISPNNNAVANLKARLFGRTVFDQFLDNRLTQGRVLPLERNTQDPTIQVVAFFKPLTTC